MITLSGRRTVILVWPFSRKGGRRKKSILPFKSPQKARSSLHFLPPPCTYDVILFCYQLNVYHVTYPWALCWRHRPPWPRRAARLGAWRGTPWRRPSVPWPPTQPGQSGTCPGWSGDRPLLLRRRRRKTEDNWKKCRSAISLITTVIADKIQIFVVYQKRLQKSSSGALVYFQSYFLIGLLYDSDMIVWK